MSASPIWARFKSRWQFGRKGSPKKWFWRDRIRPKSDVSRWWVSMVPKFGNESRDGWVGRGWSQSATQNHPNWHYAPICNVTSANSGSKRDRKSRDFCYKTRLSRWNLRRVGVRHHQFGGGLPNAFDRRCERIGDDCDGLGIGCIFDEYPSGGDEPQSRVGIVEE